MGEFGIRLMVVDDSELWHDQVRQILEQYPGLEIVATAQTGEEAIIKARLRHPDVVVMDLGLPKMNGFEAAKQIREEFPEVKFVFFSVQSNPATISAVLSLKGCAYVTRREVGLIWQERSGTLCPRPPLRVGLQEIG